MKPQQKIIAVGGGSGTSSLLAAMKEYDTKLVGAVTLYDDGGSTGRLRREYSIPAVGDLRQILRSLLHQDELLKELLPIRFSDGSLGGHNLGNIILNGLIQEKGSLESVLKMVNKSLIIPHRILPTSYQQAELGAIISGREYIGQTAVTQVSLKDHNVEKLFLTESVCINPVLQSAITEADKVVICPGDLLASVSPHFLIDGFVAALNKTSAQKILVINATNKADVTEKFTVSDYVKYFTNLIGEQLFDTIIFNTQIPNGDYPMVQGDINELEATYPKIQFIADDLVGYIYKPKAGDVIQRAPVRYDMKKLAQLILYL